MSDKLQFVAEASTSQSLSDINVLA